MIQDGIVLKVGSGAGFNAIGAWTIVIPSVAAESKWSQYVFSPVDKLPSATVIGSVNLEVGVGAPGFEIRRWKSLFHIGGGSELEFDDSYWCGYIPYTFKVGEAVSVRTASLISVSINIDFQLQLYS